MHLEKFPAIVCAIGDRQTLGFEWARGNFRLMFQLGVLEWRTQWLKFLILVGSRVFLGIFDL
jgi:hypothetical protein